MEEKGLLAKMCEAPGAFFQEIGEMLELGKAKRSFIILITRLKMALIAAYRAVYGRMPLRSKISDLVEAVRYYISSILNFLAKVVEGSPPKGTSEVQKCRFVAARRTIDLFKSISLISGNSWSLGKGLYSLIATVQFRENRLLSLMFGCVAVYSYLTAVSNGYKLLHSFLDGVRKKLKVDYLVSQFNSFLSYFDSMNIRNVAVSTGNYLHGASKAFVGLASSATRKFWDSTYSYYCEMRHGEYGELMKLSELEFDDCVGVYKVSEDQAEFIILCSLIDQLLNFEKGSAGVVAPKIVKKLYRNYKNGKYDGMLHLRYTVVWDKFHVPLFNSTIALAYLLPDEDENVSIEGWRKCLTTGVGLAGMELSDITVGGDVAYSECLLSARGIGNSSLLVDGWATLAGNGFTPSVSVVGDEENPSPSNSNEENKGYTTPEPIEESQQTHVSNEGFSVNGGVIVGSVLSTAIGNTCENAVEKQNAAVGGEAQHSVSVLNSGALVERMFDSARSEVVDVGFSTPVEGSEQSADDEVSPVQATLPAPLPAESIINAAQNPASAEDSAGSIETFLAPENYILIHNMSVQVLTQIAAAIAKIGSHLAQAFAYIVLGTNTSGLLNVVLISTGFLSIGRFLEYVLYRPKGASSIYELNPLTESVVQQPTNNVVDTFAVINDGMQDDWPGSLRSLTKEQIDRMVAKAIFFDGKFTDCQMPFINEYSCGRLIFVSGISDEAKHNFANASRTIIRSFLSEHIKGNEIFIGVDLGFFLLNADTDSHLDFPNKEWRDCGRVQQFLSDVKKEQRGRNEVVLYKGKELDNSRLALYDRMYERLTTAAGNGIICCDRFQDCSVRKTRAIAMDSAYNIPVTDLVTNMHRRGICKLTNIMCILPEMLMFGNFSSQELGIRWCITDNNDNLLMLEGDRYNQIGEVVPSVANFIYDTSHPAYKIGEYKISIYYLTNKGSPSFDSCKPYVHDYATMMSHLIYDQVVVEQQDEFYIYVKEYVGTSPIHAIYTWNKSTNGPICKEQLDIELTKMAAEKRWYQMDLRCLKNHMLVACWDKSSCSKKFIGYVDGEPFAYLPIMKKDYNDVADTYLRNPTNLANLIALLRTKGNNIYITHNLFSGGSRLNDRGHDALFDSIIVIQECLKRRQNQSEALSRVVSDNVYGRTPILSKFYSSAMAVLDSLVWLLAGSAFDAPKFEFTKNFPAVINKQEITVVIKVDFVRCAVVNSEFYTTERSVRSSDDGTRSASSRQSAVRVGDAHNISTTQGFVHSRSTVESEPRGATNNANSNGAIDKPPLAHLSAYEKQVVFKFLTGIRYKFDTVSNFYDLYAPLETKVIEGGMTYRFHVSSLFFNHHCRYNVYNDEERKEHARAMFLADSNDEKKVRMTTSRRMEINNVTMNTIMETRDRSIKLSDVKFFTFEPTFNRRWVIYVPLNNDKWSCGVHCMMLALALSGRMVICEKFSRFWKHGQKVSTETLEDFCKALLPDVDICADVASNLNILNRKEAKTINFIGLNKHWCVAIREQTPGRIELTEHLRPSSITYHGHEEKAYDDNLADCVEDLPFKRMHTELVSYFPADGASGKLEVKILNGVAGSGKSKFIMGTMSTGSYFLVHTRERCSELRKREVVKDRGIIVKTYNSGVLKFLTDARREDTLVIDEYGLFPLGALIKVLKNRGACEVILVGDNNQISGSDNEVLSHLFNYQLMSCGKHSLTNSYRCPEDVCDVIRDYLAIEIYSISGRKKSIITGRYEPEVSLEELILCSKVGETCFLTVNRKSHDAMDYVMKSLCKNHEVQTVLTAQGKEYKRVILVCSEPSSKLWKQKSYLYTALTRHKDEIYVICSAADYEAFSKIPIIKALLSANLDTKLPLRVGGTNLSLGVPFVLPERRMYYPIKVFGEDRIIAKMEPNGDSFEVGIPGSVAFTSFFANHIWVKKNLTTDSFTQGENVKVSGVDRQHFDRKRFSASISLVYLNKIHCASGNIERKLPLSSEIINWRRSAKFDGRRNRFKISRHAVIRNLFKNYNRKAARFSEYAFSRYIPAGDKVSAMKTIFGRYIESAQYRQLTRYSKSYMISRFLKFFHLKLEDISRVTDEELGEVQRHVLTSLKGKIGYNGISEIVAVIDRIKYNGKTQHKNYFCNDLDKCFHEKFNQGVLATDKELNLMYGWIFQIIEKKLRQWLPDWAVIFNGCNESYFEPWLKSHWVKGFHVMECDYTMFDATQNNVTQWFEKWICEQLFPGCSSFMRRYFDFRAKWYAKCEEMSWQTNYVKTSGEPATLFMNTVVNMFVTAVTLDYDKISFCAFKGDDSVVQARKFSYNTQHFSVQEKITIKKKINVIDGVCRMAGFFFCSEGIFCDYVKILSKIISREYVSTAQKTMKSYIYDYQEGVQALVGNDTQADRIYKLIAVNAEYYKIGTLMAFEMLCQVCAFTLSRQSKIVHQLHFASPDLGLQEMHRGRDIKISKEFVVSPVSSLHENVKKHDELGVNTVLPLGSDSSVGGLEVNSLQKKGTNGSIGESTMESGCCKSANGQAVQVKIVNGDNIREGECKECMVSKGCSLEEGFLNTGQKVILPPPSSVRKKSADRSVGEATTESERCKSANRKNMQVRFVNRDKVRDGRYRECVVCKGCSLGENFGNNGQKVIFLPPSPGDRSKDRSNSYSRSNIKVVKRVCCFLLFFFLLRGVMGDQEEECYGLYKGNRRNNASNPLIGANYRAIENQVSMAEMIGGGICRCRNGNSIINMADCNSDHYCIKPVYESTWYRNSSLGNEAWEETHVNTFIGDSSKRSKCGDMLYMVTANFLVGHRNLQESDEPDHTVHASASQVLRGNRKLGVSTSVTYQWKPLEKPTFYSTHELSQNRTRINLALGRGVIFHAGLGTANIKIYNIRLKRPFVYRYAFRSGVVSSVYEVYKTDTFCLSSEEDTPPVIKYSPSNDWVQRDFVFDRLFGLLNCRKLTCRRRLYHKYREAMEVGELIPSGIGNLVVDYDCNGARTRTELTSNSAISCGGTRFIINAVPGSEAPFVIPVATSLATGGKSMVIKDLTVPEGQYVVTEPFSHGSPRGIPRFLLETNSQYLQGECVFTKIPQYEDGQKNYTVYDNNYILNRERGSVYFTDKTRIVIGQPVTYFDAKVSITTSVSNCQFDCGDVGVFTNYTEPGFNSVFVYKFNAELLSCAISFYSPACNQVEDSEQNGYKLCKATYAGESKLEYFCGGKRYSLPVDDLNITTIRRLFSEVSTTLKDSYDRVVQQIPPSAIPSLAKSSSFILAISIVVASAAFVILGNIWLAIIIFFVMLYIMAGGIFAMLKLFF